MKQTPQGSGHSPKLTEFNESLGNTLRHSVWIQGGALWSPELDSMTLESPFQLGIFCHSVNISEKHSVSVSTLQSLTHHWGSLHLHTEHSVFFQTECCNPFSKLCTFSSCWLLFPIPPIPKSIKSN